MHIRHVLPAVLGAALAAAVTGSCGGDDPPTEVPPDTTVGSARVTWSLISTTGDPVSCTDLRIDNAAISIGRETKLVACGEEMSVVFDNLLQQRYPVIIELRTLGSGVAYQTSGNVVVAGGVETPVALTFEIDLMNAFNGSALITWRIDDNNAAQGCSNVDGETVRITDLEGSIAEVDVSAACSEGQATIAMLKPGLYGLRLELIDSTGMRVAVSSIQSMEVKAGEVARPLQVEFVTMLVERARLFASWTLNGAASSTAACAALDADAVVIKAFPETELIASVTATAACSAGSISAGRVPPGVRPHRVVFQLYTGLSTNPPIPAVITSTIVRGIIFRAGETSSVSADLSTM